MFRIEKLIASTRKSVIGRWHVGTLRSRKPLASRSRIGQVQSVAVIMDKFTGHSKWFGFVEMTNAEDAAKAIQQLNDTEHKGRNIQVNEARPRESNFGGGNLSGTHRSGGRSSGGDHR